MVIVDDATVINRCLAMVVRRFGAVLTSGPDPGAGDLLDAATPRARLSEIAAGQDEAFAAVQMLHGPPVEDDSHAVGLSRQSSDVGFEMLLTSSTDAIELALTVARPD